MVAWLLQGKDMATEWIAVDWGTSNLRVWVFGVEGITQLISDRGLGGLAPEEFEAALLDLIDPYLPDAGKTPIIACGMVGAKQGWHEAPYAATPCAVPGILEAVHVPVDDPRLDLRILPGVMQAKPADVMRGEETQIGGFLATHSGFDGIVCLPGTHTKWVHISAGEIVSFRTVMTGELFTVLTKHSVLRHTVGADGWDQPAFLEAVSDAMTSPQRVTAKLFGLRAGALLDGVGPDVMRSRLSGFLTGLELSGTRDYWLGQDIALIGAPALTTNYEAALAAQGLKARVFDGAPLVLAGLKAAHDGIKGTNG